MPIRNERTLLEAALEDSDTSPTLDDLEASARRPEQPAVDQDRPPLPGAVEIPHLRDTEVDARVSHVDPVVRIRSELIDDVALRRACRHRGDVCGSQRFEVPVDKRQIDIAVVPEKWPLVRVVVQPLLSDVIRPPELEHSLGCTERCESSPRLAGRLGDSGKVGEVHLKILNATGRNRTCRGGRRYGDIAIFAAAASRRGSFTRNREEPVQLPGRRWVHVKSHSDLMISANGYRSMLLTQARGYRD
ncbi:hypothetical protein [Geodermatophilus pulveris]|uniref:hypothetical protein n=1 Tax=Geodermatophilus pulveris TaxID=1564159 RepID=UPI0015C5DC6F|nr:hypothetical protein [Geodermatophilus pulveris]